MNIPTEVLQSIIENVYGGRIQKRGSEWILPSFANPNKFKLYVNIKKKTAFDFITGEGYNASQFLQAILETDAGGLNDEILRYIGSFKELSQKQPEIKKIMPRQSGSIFLPRECKPILESESLVFKNAKRYLNNRNIPDRLIEKFNLNYANGGHYDGRIIIPFYEESRLVWFQGRTIRKGAMRYDNPKGVEKSSLVYNIDAIKDICIITEGPFDAMMVDGQAIMGSMLSDWQALKIVERKPKMIILVPDNDFKKHHDGEYSVGYRGVMKSILKLVDNGYNLKKIYIAENNSGKDLNDNGIDGSRKVIQNAVPFNFKMYTKFLTMGAESNRLMKMI